MSRAVRALAVPAALGLALACAPALRAPPPAPPAPPPGGPPAAALLEDARAAFRRRPDPAAVDEAVRLFLAAAAADPQGADGLAGAVDAKVWLLDHAHPADAAALASSAVEDGQRCLARAPEAAACDYALALALGMQARERRATAVEGLKLMVEHLRRAAARDPALDRGGPERVLAQVLARAPGWPLGPGDPEAAVEAARSAVTRAPRHAPNLLALSEALLATGAADEGHAAAAQALTLARAARAEGDPDAGEWVAEAEKLAAGKARR